MATKYFIGVDPGKTGGWGIVGTDGSPVAAAPLPYQEKLLDWQQLTRQWARALELTGAFGTEGALHVCAEHPIVRSGESDTGHFNSGVNFGLIRAAAQTVGARLTTPQPHIWKSKMRLGKDKALSMRLCDELFPSMYDTIRGPRGGALDGVAEAILIAEYARRAELRIKSNERGGIEFAGFAGHRISGTLSLPAEPGSLREWAGVD
jgi:hypothetical protein